MKNVKVVGAEVNMEAINKMAGYGIMLGLAYEHGFVEGGYKWVSHRMLSKSNDELKQLFEDIDFKQSPYKIALLNKILKQYEQFQKEINENDWLLLRGQALELIEKDKDSIFSSCEVLDWDELMVKVISEFRKLGILLYDISIQNDFETIFYYLFNPVESLKLDCRDFVLHAINPFMNIYMEENSYLLSDGLLRKVWSKRENGFRPSFWETKGEKLREQVWNELFCICVCDRDLEEE